MFLHPSTKKMYVYFLPKMLRIIHITLRKTMLTSTPYEHWQLSCVELLRSCSNGLLRTISWSTDIYPSRSFLESIRIKSSIHIWYVLRNINWNTEDIDVVLDYMFFVFNSVFTFRPCCNPSDSKPPSFLNWCWSLLFFC